MEIQNKEIKSAKDTYLARIRALIAKGLRDVKFYPASTFNVPEEEVYKELNRLHAASDLPDPEVLGPRSPKSA